VRPLFIGGCERSGTTMLGAMLGGHSQCLCVPESQFIEHQFARDGFDPGALNPHQTLRRIVADRRYRLLWRVEIEPDSVPVEELGSTYPTLLRWLIRTYGHTRGKEGASVWIDQTPTNFRRSLTLLRMFPEARFVHLVRDGRAVAASLLPLDWGPNNTLDAAVFWMAQCAAGLAAESQLGPERVLRVCYEELVGNPSSTLALIARFAGLDYEPVMAEGRGFQPTSYSGRQHRLVGHPPDRSRVDSWQQSLTPRQIEIFEAEAGEFLTMLGYIPLYGIRARPATRIETARMRLGDLGRRVRNNLHRHWRAKRHLR
jgi:hypothetical protein